MPKYRVIVRKPDGSEWTATVQASAVVEVAAILEAKGLTLVRVQQNNEPSTHQILAGVISHEAPPPKPIQSLLTKCPACASPVSRDAITCPNCGHDTKGLGTYVKFAAVFLLIITLATCATCMNGHGVR